jgi:hypothetical protein
MPNAQKVDQSIRKTDHSPKTSTNGTSIDYLPALFLAAAIVFLPSGSASELPQLLGYCVCQHRTRSHPFHDGRITCRRVYRSFCQPGTHGHPPAPKRLVDRVCIAAGAGIVFPVCECAVVPVVRRLIGKGLPFSAAIAYLLGGPIVNPIVAASTALAYAFDWRIVFLRLSWVMALLSQSECSWAGCSPASKPSRTTAPHSKTRFVLWLSS